MKLFIEVLPIHKHSMLFEIEPEFLYQGVNVAYQSEILEKNNEQKYATRNNP